MSRPISESLSLLSETLGNCKTNLKEKEVADVDNIKISDVDEKIAEIQAGGGSGAGFNWIEKVTWDGYEISGSYIEQKVQMDYEDYEKFQGELKFTPKEDNVQLLTFKSDKMTIEPNVNFSFYGAPLQKGTEYTITFNYSNEFHFVFIQSESYAGGTADPVDSFFGTMR